MILFKNGQVAKKVIGAYPKKRLEAELEPALRLESPSLRPARRAPAHRARAAAPRSPASR